MMSPRRPFNWIARLPLLAAAAGVALLALSLAADARETRAPEPAAQVATQKPEHAAAIEPQQAPAVRSAKRSQAALRGKPPPQKTIALYAAAPVCAICKAGSARQTLAPRAKGDGLLRRQRARAPPTAASFTA